MTLWPGLLAWPLLVILEKDHLHLLLLQHTGMLARCLRQQQHERMLSAVLLMPLHQNQMPLRPQQHHTLLPQQRLCMAVQLLSQLRRKLLLCLRHHHESPLPLPEHD
jgi:hypothetical protein